MAAKLKLVASHGFSFDDVPVVATPKKGARKEKHVRIEMPNIVEIVANDATIKSLTGINESLKSETKDAIYETMVDLGTKSGKRPDNFLGFELDATAMCELRRKPQGLNDDEQAICAKHKVRLDTVKTEVFVINEAYASDRGWQIKIMAALKAAGLPKDVIQRMVEVDVVASEQSITDAFGLKPADCLEVLPIITIAAIRPTTASKARKAA